MKTVKSKVLKKMRREKLSETARKLWSARGYEIERDSHGIEMTDEASPVSLVEYHKAYMAKLLECKEPPLKGYVKLLEKFEARKKEDKKFRVKVGLYTLAHYMVDVFTNDNEDENAYDFTLNPWRPKRASVTWRQKWYQRLLSVILGHWSSMADECLNDDAELPWERMGQAVCSALRGWCENDEELRTLLDAKLELVAKREGYNEAQKECLSEAIIRHTAHRWLCFYILPNACAENMLLKGHKETTNKARPPILNEWDQHNYLIGPAADGVVSNRGLCLRMPTREIWCEGTRIKPKRRVTAPFHFLLKLASSQGRAVKRKELAGGDSNILGATNEARKYLKRAFKEAGKEEYFDKHVKTVQGTGYRFEDSVPVVILP